MLVINPYALLAVSFPLPSPPKKDLYGLVYFLKWSPYSTGRWWNRMVWSSYVHSDPGPLVALFARLMWRNAKEDVAEEVIVYSTETQAVVTPL